MRTPINDGLLQSDLDCSGFDLLNFSGGGGGTAHGIPAGGSAGQSLTKIDGTDYNAHWSTVTGGGGTASNPLITINVKDAPYNATGNGTSDDTVAIQNAINAVVTAGGGTVFFPSGIYLCNGAFDATTNSILKFPHNDFSVPTIGIQLLGQMPQGWVTGIEGAIIKSTKVGTGTAPALLAADAYQGTSSVAVPLFNNMMIHIRQLTFSVTTDSINGVRLDTAGWAVVEDVILQGGAYLSAPTHAGITGLWLPNSGNFAETYANRINSSAWDVAIATGEHLRAPSLIVGTANVGVKFLDGYGMSQAVILSNHCVHNIEFIGYHPVDVTISIEHADPAGTEWAKTTSDGDVYDPSNFGAGMIRYNLVNANVGYDPNPIRKNGAANINFVNMHTGSVTTAATGINIGADLRLVPLSGGGKLQARNTGTGIWADVDQWTNP